jgi:deoxyribodipyrimidine photo-lyase
VDAHNIVPVPVASSSLERAARTIRPKINSILSEWLVPIPAVVKHEYTATWVKEQLQNGVDWHPAQTIVDNQADIPEVDWITPGQVHAKEKLQEFLDR